jgi:hypothetical protein
MIIATPDDTADAVKESWHDTAAPGCHFVHRRFTLTLV